MPPRPYLTTREAAAYLESATTTQEPPLFGDYAVSLLERKIVTGEIKSEAGKEKWADTLEHHLIPAFGLLRAGELRRRHVEAWRRELGRRVLANELSPHTVNSWLAILHVIAKAMVAEYELDRNPMLGVQKFDTSEHIPFTEEQPNSLTPAELPRFLELIREQYPRHFAFVALGFGTGHRPSTLRPLRRCGPRADVLWDDGILLVRRSNSRGEKVMGTTKTKRHQRIVLPKELVDVLRWHVDRLPEGPMRKSELLFPSETGGFLSRSTLDKPMARVAKLMGLTKAITPKAMRRTFQDLCRAASVPDVVTRAVSGHATEAMQRRYSTVNEAEMQEHLGNVVSLFLLPRATPTAETEAANDAGGMQGGMQAAQKENGRS